MIIGSGLLAQAFYEAFSFREDVCIYAAGVSNSTCSDVKEFMRERQRLIQALEQAQATHQKIFVYFGTCSVTDPDVINSPYVQHKLAMEKLVQSHLGNVILRLPQVAGITSNPHTLLNFLYARISRSESFNLWSKAKRNIIDVEDVVSIAKSLIADTSKRNAIFNIANSFNYSMPEIVQEMESVVGKSAVFEATSQGSEYSIDISAIGSAIEQSKVNFDAQYLHRIVRKYYGR